MKNIIFKILAFSGVAFLVLLVNACLKDDRFVDFGAVGNTLEFMDITPGKSTSLSFADPSSSVGDSIKVRVRQAGVYATNTDLTVTLGFSQAGLDLYNTDTEHVVGTALPTDAYAYPSTVTIKAGKDALNNNNRTAEFWLVITPNKVPTTPGVNYVLSLGITAVSPETTISANKGSILFNFYKNAYDGHYTVTGTLVDVIVPTLGPWNPMDMNMETINATKSYAFSNDIGGVYHPISSGGSLSYYGNVGMLFTFDEATNDVVAVENYQDDPPPRNRLLKIDPSGINHFDAGTKTLKVKYILTQDDCGCDRTTFDETWVHD